MSHRAGARVGASIYMYALAAACESLGQLRSRCATNYRHIAAPRNTVSHSMITNTQQFTGKAAYSFPSYSLLRAGRRAHTSGDDHEPPVRPGCGASARRSVAIELNQSLVADPEVMRDLVEHDMSDLAA